MFRRRFNLKWLRRGISTRAVVACLLVSLFVGITGLPMPVSKSTNERFPCEECPCGCHSATHCWDKCCCHTDEEKLAWANANGVTPPIFLVQRVAASKQTKLASSEKIAPACCAAKKNVVSGTARTTTTTTTTTTTSKSSSMALQCVKSGVSAKPCPACAQKADGAQSSSPTKIVRSFKLVLFDPYAQCHGSGKLWKLLQLVYVSTNLGLQLDFAYPLAEHRLVENIYASSIVYWPDGPVPRYF